MIEQCDVGVVDRFNWPPGPWDGEPDKIAWVDEMTGLRCLILRTPILGNLCGYVALPPGHPWRGLHCDAIDLDLDLDVHGGITWSGELEPDREPEGFWWVGFDCGHFRDRMPGLPQTFDRVMPFHTYYRDQDYVRRECEILAAQVRAHRSSLSLAFARIALAARKLLRRP